MLIIFLGTKLELLRSHLAGIGDKVPIVLAQAGVYEIANIIQEFPDASLFVIQRDLDASGLLPYYTQNHVQNANLTIIDFDQFVELTTQHSPCITVQ